MLNQLCIFDTFYITSNIVLLDHCMVNFVKPNLLGTRREFSNRFVNPITNGQHADSTQYDVKLMKRRAHVLHEMLAGCVQAGVSIEILISHIKSSCPALV